MTRLLDGIDSPADLRRLSVEDLPRLAREIREDIIRTVSRNGGHLAPSLGVVELTIALHYVFDTPNDRVVWDVGHQTYANKTPDRPAGPLPYPAHPGRAFGIPQEKGKPIRHL